MTAEGRTRRWTNGGRAPRPSALLAALAMLGTLVAAAPAPSPPVDPDMARERLEALEAELAERARHQRELAEAAEAAGQEAEAAARRIVAVAAEVQSLEERVSALALRIDDLTTMLRDQEASLETRRGQMSRTLAALQRLTRRPTDLALLRPGDADETIKSAILLRELAPQLEAQARAIGEQVARILALREDLHDERQRLDRDLGGLEERRQALEGLRRQREADRRRLLSAAESEAARVADLAARAKDMEELLAGLEKERERRLAAARDAAERLGRRPPRSAAAPPQSAPMAQARGTLPLPARGRLVGAFGDAAGPTRSRGITIATLEGAQVVAPYDGRIAFAGPFRGYGQLLIITHSEGYHSLLAGMDRLYATVGQWVLAGEPVGMMAAGKSAEKTAATSTEDAPKLYVELRKGGEPVDPVPWLAAGVGEVSS